MSIFTCGVLKTDEERIEEVRRLHPEEFRVIPRYWVKYLEEKIHSIHQKQISAGIDAASFGAIADFHLSCNAMHSPAIMKKIMEECGIPYAFLAGDFVSGFGITPKEHLISEIEAVRRLFREIEDKMLWVMGNHDPAYSTFEAPDYYAENLTEEEIYEYMFRHQTQYPGRVFGEGGRYFYVDDVFHKVRYIGLDTHDMPSDAQKEDGHPVYPKFTTMAYCQAQVDWFTHVALQVPSRQWTVVLCTHETFEGDNCYNHELIRGVIDAFRKHTCYEGKTECEEMPAFSAKVSVDFTDGGGDFALWLGGHTHKDIVKYQQGILTMSIASDGRAITDEGTLQEQAFDIFTIDKKNHRILITRIGYGQDRELEYEVFA